MPAPSRGDAPATVQPLPRRAPPRARPGSRIIAGALGEPHQPPGECAAGQMAPETGEHHCGTHPAVSEDRDRVSAYRRPEPEPRERQPREDPRAGAWPGERRSPLTCDLVVRLERGPEPVSYTHLRAH